MKLTYLPIALTLALCLASCGSDEDELIPSVPKPKYDGSEAFTECPDEHHPHAIDLGLPSGTKWACCNMGTTQPEGKGFFFSWGETKTKNEFVWSAYQYYDASDPYHIKYENIGDSICGTKYDAAHVNLGGRWTMPSTEQAQELVTKCKRLYTTLNGTKGFELEGPNKAKIFIPLAGYKSTYGENNTMGYLWIGAHSPSELDKAIFMKVSSTEFRLGTDYVYVGMPIRPVAY